MSLNDRRNALLWALGWWFMRRMVRRRAARAVAGVTAGVTARRGPLGAVLGGVLLVGLLAGAFVVWRRMTAAPETPVLPYEPPAPAPEPAAA